MAQANTRFKAFMQAGFVLTILFSLVSFAAAQTCVQPPPGIIAWWPLDETSGTTAADRVGNHPGGYAGAPIPAEGQVRGALRFDGNDYVAVADSDLWAFGANNFTIEFWANFDTPGGGSIGHPGDIFIGSDEGPGTRNKWFFALGGGFLNFHINGPAVGSRFFPLVPFSPNVGQWYHLAVTRHGSTYTIFVDGIPRGSAIDTRLIPNANAPLTIGQAEELGFMNGRLDEVTIYNRALTEEEIQAIYGAGRAGKCIDLTIRPDKGGDTGSVSVSINGNGFVEGATVKLKRDGEPDIVGNPVTVGENGTTITTTFDLTGKTRGAWDVVVENPNSTSFILTAGFTIEKGRVAQLWVDIVGLPVIRPGREQTYWIAYGNSGNTDLHRAAIILDAGTNALLSTKSPLAWFISPDYSESPAQEIAFIVDNLSPASSGTVPIGLTSGGGGSVFLTGRAWIPSQTKVPSSLQASTKLLPPAPPPDGSVVFQDDPNFPPRTGHEGIVWYDYDGLRGPRGEVYVWENMGQQKDDPAGTRLTPWDRFIKRTYPDFPDTSRGWQDSHTPSFLDTETGPPAPGSERSKLRDWLWNHTRENLDGEPLSFDFDMKCTDSVHRAFKEALGRDLIPGHEHNVLDTPVYDYREITRNSWGGSKLGYLYEGLKVPSRFLSAVKNLLESLSDALVTLGREIINIFSFDPNDKVGSLGVEESRFLSGEEPLRYSIFFENLETATAPAQEVIITDQLDMEKMDLSTLSLGPMTFGNKQVVPPSGRSSYATDVDLRPGKNLIVRLEASLNPNTGLLTWRFTSIDLATGNLPTDPRVGFLPPNVNPPEGDGSVLFTVMPKKGLSTGTEIRNRAEIIFDVNEPIVTPEWLNTLDNTKPTSQVSSLAATQNTTTFEVRWAGDDVGSGIKDYTVFVSEDGGPFAVWLRDTPDTSGMFTGENGKIYAFYSVARDRTGNLEDAPSVADATTQVRSVILISIDIKPNSFPNSINPTSKGIIPVAILTTTAFDATTVDPLSVKFGPNAAIEAHGQGHLEDANGDGQLDLVLHFNTQDTGIVCGQTLASLTGKTMSGLAIEGSDSIETVGCK